MIDLTEILMQVGSILEQLNVLNLEFQLQIDKIT